MKDGLLDLISLRSVCLAGNDLSGSYGAYIANVNVQMALLGNSIIVVKQNPVWERCGHVIFYFFKQLKACMCCDQKRLPLAYTPTKCIWQQLLLKENLTLHTVPFPDDCNVMERLLVQLEESRVEDVVESVVSSHGYDDLTYEDCWWQAWGIQDRISRHSTYNLMARFG